MTIVRHEDRPDYFRGCVYLTQSNEVFCPDGEVRSRRAFNARYGHRLFFDSAGKRIPSAWLALVNSPDLIRVETYNLSTLCVETEKWLATENAAANRRDDVIAGLEKQLELIRAKEGRRKWSRRILSNHA